MSTKALLLFHFCSNNGTFPLCYVVRDPIWMHTPMNLSHTNAYDCEMRFAYGAVRDKHVCAAHMLCLYGIVLAKVDVRPQY